jgi:hypothetical protein
MKQAIAIMLMSLFAAGCTLGVPIIDDQVAHENGNAGADSDDDRNKQPERDRPQREPIKGDEGATAGPD